MADDQAMLEQLRSLRISVEEERQQAIKRISQLEAENKKLKEKLAEASSKPAAPAPASTPAPAPAPAPASTTRVPPGHTEYTWSSPMVGTTATVPPGHTEYTWGATAAGSDQQVDSSSASGQAPAIGMYKRTPINRLLFAPQGGLEYVDQTVTVCGWARTVRVQGGGKFAFVELNDGSCFTNLQNVVNDDCEGWTQLSATPYVGLSLRITGKVVKSPGKNQKVEVKATEVEILGECDPLKYPMAKGRVALETLRGIAHLRPRTNTIGSMARVRNTLAMAVHEFFQKHGAAYVHTPILTSADCEGAGEQFCVSTLPHPTPVDKQGQVDYSKDFFGQRVFLSVSGQLEAEVYANALTSVYTFGPTFRAENSHTARHLAEFWMIEPEFAFANLDDNIRIAVGFIKYCIQAVLDRCGDELNFFDKFVSKGLKQHLAEIISKEVTVVTYTKAIEDCAKAKKKWEFQPKWGEDLASEHERYLTEDLYKGPVVVTDWPKDIKAFYMRLNDDNKTVAAMDVLLPRVGEMIGGSQREERIDVLHRRMEECGVEEGKTLKWYTDLRRFGTTPHSGFGLGFERLVMLCTGLENIRDAIPFPRYPGHCEY